ncbi:hypothetical protein ACD591_20925 [Rufibacter glacialis]|uniref:Uncharacterized protein n=1 Tax=Rufibacter glacialis TaxID=1259555 RepID=A0A5M8Q6R6_9BACT|nr:hypothetical protein [Rufibacter glacialis]KAA6430312.1 hypothetical protein FOE74_21110 [Rufibacter glacialis]GGK88206.1 hypothetical protein GCM10011405_39970 [Rufibacter glacialis]
MALLNSELFFSAWLDSVTNRKEILLTDWRNSKVYTNLIKSSEECILRDVADKLNLKCYAKDYYSIDSVLYTDEDLVPGIQENTYWFRQIKVAFEHENNFNGGLYQEVAHLLITNSELKVLVTYPNGDTTHEMDYLHKIIRGCNHQKELSDKESFLLIFGYESDFEWEAFVYKEDYWKRIVVGAKQTTNLVSAGSI